MIRPLFLGSAAAFAIMPGAAWSQDINLNYDNLSSFEEPLSLEAGNVTISVTGLADANITADFDDLIDDDEVTLGFVTNVQVAAETQLANRWTIGAAYFGQYSDNTIGVPEDYTDNVAGFIGTSFGTIIGGNVNQQVRELTRRRRGVGNSFLAFDDFYGQLDNWGGAYVGRCGPSVIGAVVDENGDFEVGAQFQRPIGERDVRFTGRYRQTRFNAPDGITRYDTRGIGLVGELVYGSTLYDLGAGYERLDGALIDIDRWFVSAGGQSQFGPLQLSVEGHYGEVDGASEVSGAVGASYALARGLSLNLGGNYANAKLSPDGATLIDLDEVTAVSSLRFSF